MTSSCAKYMSACPGLREAKPNIMYSHVVGASDDAPDAWNGEFEVAWFDCEHNPFTQQAFFNEVRQAPFFEFDIATRYRHLVHSRCRCSFCFDPSPRCLRASISISVAVSLSRHRQALVSTRIPFLSNLLTGNIVALVTGDLLSQALAESVCDRLVLELPPKE